MIHFRMKFHSELLLHRCDYALLQADYLLRECLTGMIHYHKRLLVPYCRTTASAAFPSALFYHPGCGHLDSTVRQIIMRNLIVRPMLGLCRRLYSLEVLMSDDRILEETAGAAHYGWFREFLLADPDDDLADERGWQF